MPKDNLMGDFYYKIYIRRSGRCGMIIIVLREIQIIMNIIGNPIYFC